MGLGTYRQKRQFGQTPEPRGKSGRHRGGLHFVVQKHHASRLHYDFRLELDGVLKSWAVPKGPSLNPGDKRLAMMVEDHPLEYRTFEGIIPEGNYGAGSVIVWDEGTYTVPGVDGRAEAEQALREGLARGNAKLDLAGSKLRGEFALVRMPRAGQNAWLLIKHRDQFASEEDVTALDRSVVSGRTLVEVAAEASRDGAKPSAARSAAKTRTLRRAGRKKSTKPSEPPPLPALTNLDKVYWPGEGITKGHLIGYYHLISGVLLPYLRDRPLSLNRHPNGIEGKSFFQKDVSRQPPPDWVQTTVIRSESDGKSPRYLLCQDEASLLYVANLGCIELNPWASRVAALDRPDYLAIDLDPEDIPFARVVETALAVRSVLDAVDVPSYCKTSGKRGLHICVPLAAAYDYDLARQFAELIARLVHARLPHSTSLARQPAHRQKRVYLDFLQNGRGKTLAAPYSLRPVPGAPVSTPLAWKELKPHLDPKAFSIGNMAQRVERVGDLWAPLLGPGVDLPKCLERLTGRLGGA
jgi:bifunctional non-homologous end joining protein LigD